MALVIYLMVTSLRCIAILDLIEVVSSVMTTEEGTSPTLDPMAVWQEVMEQSLGFLRCCALFYHYLSGVAAPTELTSLLPPDQEFVHLAKYLAIPNSPKQLLDSPFSLLLAKKWANHPHVHIELSKASPSLKFVTTIPKLIDLPDDYSELINNISNFSCPRSVGEESRIPSMCLVCGTVVCSQSYCCQTELDGVTVGACTAHSHKCGAGGCWVCKINLNCLLIRIRPVPEGEGVQAGDVQWEDQGVLHATTLPGPVRGDRPGAQERKPSHTLH